MSQISLTGLFSLFHSIKFLKSAVLREQYLIGMERSQLHSVQGSLNHGKGLLLDKSGMGLLGKRFLSAVARAFYRIITLTQLTFQEGRWGSGLC